MKTNTLLALAGVLIGFHSVSAQAADPILINGAGATFPYPLYSKWFSEYRKVDPSVEINYQSIGSGGGVRQLLDKTVDFGASDAPMTDEQLAKATVPVMHVPTVLGAVVLTYNIPGLSKELRLSPELVAGIFLGQITQWNDAKIAAINPGVALPKDLPVIVAHRSDGSGTTAIFADYLSKVSPQWKEKVGAGTALKWPTGLGGKGNEGVTGLVKQTPGAIGYVELIFAESNKLPVATLQNPAKQWVKPSVTAVTAAAASSLKQMPADFRVSITNAAGKEAYPISGFTYLLVYKKLGKEKGGKLLSFLGWALKQGQGMASALAYAPLPKTLAIQVEKKLKEIQTE